MSKMFSTVRKTFQQSFQLKRYLHRLTYEPLTEKHYDEVMDHLRSTSYNDVPLYKAAGLIGSAEIDKVYLESMKEGVSMIVLKEGKLAGVIINGILTPDAVPGAIANMKKSTNINYKKMDYMFLMLLLELDIFDRFGINRAMECRLLSTTREYRGTGLGKILVDKLTGMARDMDYPMIVGEAVNNYLWKLLVSEGWIMLRELPYDDYIEEATGESLFKVAPPHHILGVCARIIDNKCKSKDPLPLPNPKIYYPIKMD